jgi:hypothetical protein
MKKKKSVISANDHITKKLKEPGLARRVIRRSEPRTQTSRMLNCLTRRQATSIRAVPQLQGLLSLLPPFPSALCLCADSLLPFVQLGSLERVSISRECYCFSELWGNYNKRERLLGFEDLLRCYRSGLRVVKNLNNYISNADPTFNHRTMILFATSSVILSGSNANEKEKRIFKGRPNTTKTVCSRWVVMSRSRTSL